jgi:hypothetical protein
VNALKRVLFDAYGGFADKRIKNLDKASTFIVDDRTDSDFGADRGLKSYFCAIFVEVHSNAKITVTLCGNVPFGKKVERWLAKNGYEIETRGGQSLLAFDVERGKQSILGHLSEAIASIVASGAPRYEVKSYKYLCPRTAESLRRLKSVLDDAWSRPLPERPRGFFAPK